MAYDRQDTIYNYYDFFKNILPVEKDLSKVPKNIKKLIKHDYLSKDKKEKEDNSAKKGLFCTDDIMAYLFVFDYNDDKSLE